MNQNTIRLITEALEVDQREFEDLRKEVVRLKATVAKLISTDPNDTQRLNYLINALNHFGTDRIGDVLRWEYPGLDRADIDVAMEKFPIKD